MTIHTRRQFAWTFTAALAGMAVARPPGALAADDDDSPPNVFISPCGRPFRARPGAPYPVVDWFKQADKNGDGKLDHAEFQADAGAFFDMLDLNKDGVLDGLEIQVYERRVAPEILGYRVSLGAVSPGWGEPRLWRAQMPGSPGPAGDVEPQDHPPRGLDESAQGASPYGFFSAPEPVTAADSDFRGIVRKANFLALSDRHFALLDSDHQGFLTLARLPKTPIQEQLERTRRRRM